MKVTRAKRIVAMIGAVVLGGTLMVGCGTNNKRDQEDVKSYDADYAETYTNGDSYPNTTLQCIRGVGIATTTRTGAGAWHRVPEWDKFCSQFPQHAIDKSQERKNG
jgi:hypothetical protein